MSGNILLGVSASQFMVILRGGVNQVRKPLDVVGWSRALPEIFSQSGVRTSCPELFLSVAEP